MATTNSKPKGMNPQTLEDMQAQKNDNDFILHVNMTLQKLGAQIEAINVCIKELIAKEGSLHVASLASISLVADDVKSKLSIHNKTLADIRVDVNSLQETVISMVSKSSNFAESALLGELIGELQKRIDQICKDKQAMNSEINGLIERLKIEFNQKLVAQKNEILSIPSDLPAHKKDFDQKIELVELNGQNAHLRSSNNEKSIMLLDRKLDNIYQQLKTLQIAAQDKK